MTSQQSPQVLHIGETTLSAEDHLSALDQQFQAASVETAADSWQYLERTSVDCIVSEYELPEATGIEFLSELRETDSSVPFVLVTDHRGSDVIERAVARGATDYFRATVEPDPVLVSRVEAAIQRHNSENAEQARANLEHLHDVANRLHAADSLEACYDITVGAAVEILGFDWCTFIESTPDGEEFEIRAVSENGSHAVGDRPFGTDDGVAGQVYRTKESAIVNDIETSERAQPTVETIRSALSVPVGDRGVFQAVATQTGAFDERDQEQAELLTNSLATALDRLEKRDELRSQRAELRRQNERLDQFASVISHDLRNPLNVASLRLELAREECNSKHLDDVTQAHERMETLIEDLLTLAREGERIDDPEMVAFEEVMHQCWAHVPTREATLHVDCEQWIKADRSQLEQLLENLVRNAVEHGGDSVTVTVGSLESGFFVEDDGPGIPPEEREYVFELGHTSTADGTGFGLSIVKQAVDAHGWSVAVTESESGGARFEITGVGTAG